MRSFDEEGIFLPATQVDSLESYGWTEHDQLVL